MRKAFAPTYFTLHRRPPDIAPRPRGSRGTAPREGNAWFRWCFTWNSATAGISAATPAMARQRPAPARNPVSLDVTPEGRGPLAGSSSRPVGYGTGVSRGTEEILGAAPGTGPRFGVFRGSARRRGRAMAYGRSPPARGRPGVSRGTARPPGISVAGMPATARVGPATRADGRARLSIARRSIFGLLPAGLVRPIGI